MSSLKTIHGVTVLAKTESTYNTDPTPGASTDGVLFLKPFEKPKIRRGYDGVRTRQPGGYGHIPMAPKLGYSVSGTLRTELAGAGAAYTSSSVVPKNGFHPLIKSAGFVATVTTTGGSEHWTYTLTGAGTAPSSATLWEYFNGELHKINGVYSDLIITAANAGIPVWEFPYVGTWQPSVPADTTQADPSGLSYSVVPPSFAAAGPVAWSDWNTGIIRSWNFKLGRLIDNPRTNINQATGHAGFTPGGIDPVLELLVEATALVGSPYHSSSGLNPYILDANSPQNLALTLQCGSTLYNNWYLSFDQGVQFLEPPELVDEDPVALWRMRLRPYTTSTGPATNGITIVAQ